MSATCWHLIAFHKMKSKCFAMSTLADHKDKTWGWDFHYYIVHNAHGWVGAEAQKTIRNDDISLLDISFAPTLGSVCSGVQGSVALWVPNIQDKMIMWPNFLNEPGHYLLGEFPMLIHILLDILRSTDNFKISSAYHSYLRSNILCP